MPTKARMKKARDAKLAVAAAAGTATKTVYENTPFPADAKAEAPVELVRVATPGTVPSRAAQRFMMPAIRQMHYSILFPDSLPKPHETEKGVFTNPDGSLFQPRELVGGQFAALFMTIGGKFGGVGRRQIGLPLNTQPGDYPLQKHEKVLDRVEVIFDFEDQLQNFLAQYDTANGDPIKAAFAKGGVDPRLYDSESTSPHAGAFANAG